MIKHMEEIIGDDKDLLKKVIPDYPPYGKRMLVDNNWFDMLKQDNVELITGNISHINEYSLIDANNVNHNSDVIVTATGFNASKMLWPMEVIGKDKKSILEYWQFDNQGPI